MKRLFFGLFVVVGLCLGLVSSEPFYEVSFYAPRMDCTENAISMEDYVVEDCVEGGGKWYLTTISEEEGSSLFIRYECGTKEECEQRESVPEVCEEVRKYGDVIVMETEKKCGDNGVVSYKMREVVTCYGVKFSSNKVCSGHGTCYDDDGENDGMCGCYSTHLGDQCDQSKCYGRAKDDPKVCGDGKGDCNADGTCTCHLPEKYGGDDCTVPVCNGEASPDSCSNNGICDQDTNTCECEGNWIGDKCDTPLCFGIAATEPTVCSGNGKCLNDHSCNCVVGGSQCELPTCFDKFGKEACSGNGICESVDKCLCLADWGGPDCATSKCNGVLAGKGACSDHGTCSVHTCVCNNDWDGLDCEIPKCNGKSGMEGCNNAGICRTNSTTGEHYCHCDDLWRGEKCEIATCFGEEGEEACSSHGSCKSDHTCKCHDGFGGDLCEVTECYGEIPEEACSGNGACVDEECHCEQDAKGEQCDTPTCNGASGESACSGVGFCLSDHTCSCLSVWFGFDCEIPKCFDIPQTDPTVCGSHGTCLQDHSCSCVPDWGSDDCSMPKCDGKIEPEACYGHGDCKDDHSCDCWEGFGPQGSCISCKCNGILSTDASVCNYHGECLSPNNCTCEADYSGQFCSVYTMPLSTVLVIAGSSGGGVSLVVLILVCIVCCCVIQKRNKKYRNPKLYQQIKDKDQIASYKDSYGSIGSESKKT